MKFAGAASSSLGSKDLQFNDGDWIYHDSYLGESDFIGQEIVYYQHKPIWGLNYFGVIFKPDLITSSQAGQMIMKSLTHMYSEGRFLGGFTYSDGPLTYVDSSEGNVGSFRGKEHITLPDKVVYELFYHGGVLKA
jgi:hypothetical protein